MHVYDDRFQAESGWNCTSILTLLGSGRQKPPGKYPVPIVQKAGLPSGPVWTGAENLAPTAILSPDRPARSQSLYRLRYPAHRKSYCKCVNMVIYVLCIVCVQMCTVLVPSGGNRTPVDKYIMYEGWNFNRGNYLFTTDTK